MEANFLLSEYAEPYRGIAVSLQELKMMTEHIMGDSDAEKAPIPSYGFRWDRTLMNFTPGRIPDGVVHYDTANKSNLVI